MMMYCVNCGTELDVPAIEGPAPRCERCGTQWWSSARSVQRPVASGGYTPTEVDALRAEVAALKAQNERVRLVNKEGAAQVAQLQTELTQLRALRDRLVAIPRGPNQAIWFDDILALIKTAEALAKESP